LYLETHGCYKVMHWSNDVTKWEGSGARVRIWSGSYEGISALAPPSNSWAAHNHVGIFHVSLQPGSQVDFPSLPSNEFSRSVFFVEGDEAMLEEEIITRTTQATVLEVEPNQPLRLSSKGQKVEFLILEGKKIKEPVVQHGPFVMNTSSEIQQAFQDYQNTQFGGWPWDQEAMVFPRQKGRFSLINGVESFPTL